MRKILSLITILLGFFQIIFGALMLSQIGVLSIKTINGSSRDIYIIFIIFWGIVTFWVGFFTLKNPGSSSLITLLATLTVNVIILIINGWSNGFTISLLIISGISSITILVYLITKNIQKVHNKNR